MNDIYFVTAQPALMHHSLLKSRLHRHESAGLGDDGARSREVIGRSLPSPAQLPGSTGDVFVGDRLELDALKTSTLLNLKLQCYVAAGLCQLTETVWQKKHLVKL
jgi:hypothetical protein